MPFEVEYNWDAARPGATVVSAVHAFHWKQVVAVFAVNLGALGVWAWMVR